MDVFYRDIQPIRQQVAKNERMRLQTDLDFQQNDMKRLNQKFNVEMFSSHVCGEKTYAAEQKIREFKNFCSKAKKYTRQPPPALRSV